MTSGATDVALDLRQEGLNMRETSTAVVYSGTLIQTAREILLIARKPLAPKQIAYLGVRFGLLKVPRGRTRGYLTQLIQSAMYGRRGVKRLGYGKYSR